MLARIYNDRGALVLPAVVTDGVARGVVSITEGSWYQPDSNGLDRGGNPNLVNLDRPSACGATTYNSCLVEVEAFRE
jgi:anaerobic dimethyl sulfoxide reductase subunit A